MGEMRHIVGAKKNSIDNYHFIMVYYIIIIMSIFMLTYICICQHYDYMGCHNDCKIMSCHAILYYNSLVL